MKSQPTPSSLSMVAHWLVLRETRPNTKLTEHNSQTRTFTYGARGELLSISDNGKLTASYQYNHALQRISKTVAGKAENNSQSTQYHWHGGLLDAESQLDSQGNPQITKRYFYLNLRPVAVIEYAGSTNQQRQDASPSTQLYAIHSDHLGTPQVLSNAQQQVVWQAEYASFGQATVTAKQLNQGAESSRIESNSASNAYGLISTAQANTQQPSVAPKHFEFNLRFAGQYADTESGYHYNWHRYYDPATGRYLTPDPIGLQGGLNAYGYVGQNPLQGVDPAGLRSTVFEGRIIITPEDSTVPSVILPNNVGAVGIGPSDTFFHQYNVTSPSTITACQAVYGFTTNPTPGNDSPATSLGTINDVGPIPTAGNHNYVRTYLIESAHPDRYTNMIVNHTIAGLHGLTEGYVIRFGEIQADGSIILRSYGEGNNWRQAPSLEFIWGPQGEKVWQGNHNEIISNASKCGCK